MFAGREERVTPHSHPLTFMSRVWVLKLCSVWGRRGLSTEPCAGVDM